MQGKYAMCVSNNFILENDVGKPVIKHSILLYYSAG